MLVKTYCAALQGMEAITVKVEVSMVRGINFHLTGLPDNAVRESLDRIKAAIVNSGLKFPSCDITANMAPADIRKEGSGYDLPLAMAILAADGKVPADRIARYMLIGELGLDGTLMPARGALSIAIKARSEQFDGLIVPQGNAMEAAVVNNLKVYGMEKLSDVIRFFSDQSLFQPIDYDTRQMFYDSQSNFVMDFADVKGQENVKRALEVAAAGGHNIIMIGPPGSGKSMMARCLPSILPPLSLAESLETTRIYSVAGLLGRDSSLITQRPFRSPHHTISPVAFVGGGRNPQPGEISLAHNGVLFCDELPEFTRQTLEVLRQPLEDRKVVISRINYSVEFPSSFMFVASMNPCPCGYYGDPTHQCKCLPGQIMRYMHKISGPLLDRIDIHTEINPVPIEEITSFKRGESSAEIRARVVKARLRQEQRYKDTKGVYCNAQMTEHLIQQYAQPDVAGMDMLRAAMKKLSLSARAYNRILKVARTIADLEGCDQVGVNHIAEAVSYRSLDRGDWAERGTAYVYPHNH